MWRGEHGSMQGRPGGLPVPPARMPLFHGRRARKRWRYVGAFGEAVMVCVGYARVGPGVQGWWTIWDRESGELTQRTTSTRGGVHLPAGRAVAPGIDLRYDVAGEFEVVSLHGGAPIWTRKAELRVHGLVKGRDVTMRGLRDDSAGYHARHTEWRWSAGVGETRDGRAVTWNLVDGVHDDPSASENTVFVDGVAHHVGSVRFGDDLGWVEAGGERLEFTEESRRTHAMNLLVARNRYEQPFGTFAGALPVAGALARGYGVMEYHDAYW